MSSKKHRTAGRPGSSVADRVSGSPAAPAAVIHAEDRRHGLAWWMFAAGFLIATFLTFEVYGPALNGEFVFDDSYLPFMSTELQQAPLRSWLGVRPFLMFSYWLNYQAGGVEPYAYHALNVVLHVLNAVLAWAIVRRLLGSAGESGASREILSVFASALFLMHPVQTESVAYVASRSETLSIFFFLCAYTVFLYRRRSAVSWRESLMVLVLFGIACTVKEHTTVLPALLLLTDYYFTTPFRFEGIRRNLRLYVPVVVGGALGVVAVWQVLSTAQTAGFAAVQEFTWYQYLFTQFRVIWTYLRLFVLPVGQNGDYVYPVSYSFLDHGTVFALLGLLVVSVFAWRCRREYPLASFGWFGFLLLLAPTSSVVPIRDVIAERRMYLPFFCLLLITVDLIRRWRPSPALLAAALTIVIAVAGFASWERNKVWSNALLFWTDAVEQSPDNPRARFQLAFAQWQRGSCKSAAENYEKVYKHDNKEYRDRLLVDWALALDCLNKPDEAISKLKEAAVYAPSALIQAQMGMLYGKSGRSDQALESLAAGEKMDPNFEMIHVNRGHVYFTRGEYAAAAASYQRALAINPNSTPAQEGLARVRGQQR